MPDVRDVTIPFPTKGLIKRFGYSHQPPNSTPYSLNVYPYEWETGRERGGVRPGIGTATTGPTDPSFWCEATWRVNGGGSLRGVAVSGTDGTYFYIGSGWSKPISTASGSTFTTCTVYDDWLIQGDLGSTIGSTKIQCYNLYESATGNLTDAQAACFPTALGLTKAGTAPTNCGIVQRWNDRLMVAGSLENPHRLFASKMGNILDWDYTNVALSGAWTSTGAEGGQIGEPITALIPHNKDCLLIGCTDSLYVMRGNPRAGGSLSAPQFLVRGDDCGGSGSGRTRVGKAL